MSIIFVGVSVSFLWAQNGGYATQSVLANGDWYKIACIESGVYRLSYNDIQALGLNPSSIDPRTIKIYGNGGGMLPQANAAFRHDDLVQNAISVIGEEDGSFDPGDYVIFYGESPHVWKHNDSDVFRHEYHLYADTNYYFLTIGEGLGRRINTIPNTSEPTVINPRTRILQFHESEEDNPIGSGRFWLGEFFDGSAIRSRSFSFYIPDADREGEIVLRMRGASRSSNTTSFQVQANGENMGTLYFNATNLGSIEVEHYKTDFRTFSLSPASVESDSVKLTFTYNNGGAQRSQGWLDYIEVSYDAVPNLTDSHARQFYVSQTDQSDFIANVALTSDVESPTIWNVTDPTNPFSQQYLQTGNQVTFSGEVPNSFAHYIAFKDQFLQPVSISAVANQDLHGLESADYVIITHPLFLSEAQRLANFHQQQYGRSTLVTTPQLIYNEFSSGKQDVSAIRDFIRMHYVRSQGQKPGHVLLMGDGTYDYKNIRELEDPTNFVITYQSRNSWQPPISYTSDDFFVMMDEKEGFWGEDSGIQGDVDEDTSFLDIAIGRLPVTSARQARDMVDKIIDYVTNPAGKGEWRSKIVLVADHKPKDLDTHHRQANNLTYFIDTANACMNVEKLYMDNYELVPTASRPSFPEGRRAVLNSLDEGSLIVNYTGHGGESGWSDASILTTTDVNNMKNGLRLPCVVTATCEFGRYDNPLLTSGAEEMLLRSDGGAIALLTTVRVVYAYQNSLLNQAFYQYALTYDPEKKRMPTLGEIMANTKNTAFTRPAGTPINSRNFSLLGDPGIILNYPELNAEITHINDLPIDEAVQDTFQSLSIVKASGIIKNNTQDEIEDFDGDMEVTVFDKPTRFVTQERNFAFYWQINRIFDGMAGVEDGKFDFEFVVPINISYDDDGLTGKMKLYFFNESIDGLGCYQNFTLGGTEASAQPDNLGPEIQMYLNDSSTWVDGGITGPAPILYANVSDPSGINTVAGGIGHELIGILDDDDSEVILMNEFYSADRNSYSSGTVAYPFEGLSPGPHSLKLRVWDGANNASEAVINFEVANDPQKALDRVVNIPNPMTDQTEFLIGHNQAGNRLRIKVDIYNTSGQLVRSLIEDDYLAIGNTYQGLTWNGTDQQGNFLANGLYIFQVSVRDLATQQEAREVKKLLIMR